MGLDPVGLGLAGHGCQIALCAQLDAQLFCSLPSIVVFQFKVRDVVVMSVVGPDVVVDDVRLGNASDSQCCKHAGNQGVQVDSASVHDRVPFGFSATAEVFLVSRAERFQFQASSTASRSSTSTSSLRSASPLQGAGVSGHSPQSCSTASRSKMSIRPSKFRSPPCMDRSRS